MRIIGIDLGERRIGFAASDASETLATPVKTIERGPSDASAVELLSSTITEIADGEEVGSIVVGLPRRLDGSPNLQTPRVKKIVEMLSKQLSIPVVTQDERLSSHEAEERLAFAREGLAAAQGQAGCGGRGGDSAGLSGCAQARVRGVEGVERVEGVGGV